MSALLIAVAMALVFWLGYSRGHNAGKRDQRIEYFARLVATRTDFWKPGNFDHAGREFVEEDRDGR